jgi:putative tryptophan/tyrosine transport system substrate-binding protein
MNRRELMALLGGAAVLPVAARAQQAAVPVIGFLHNGLPEPNAHLLAVFRRALGEAGFVEGRNVVIEYRWAQNDNNRLPELAADLVRRKVAVIATPFSAAAALAAKAATATIPIIFSTGADPVQIGLVASLSRPGGNVTGVSYMAAELTAKRLGLLRELVPQAARIAVLVNPISPLAESVTRNARATASAIGRQIEFVRASTEQEINVAFASLAHIRVDALSVSPDVLFYNRRLQLTSLAARQALPTIYPFREDAEAGGLMSYGASPTGEYQQIGIYVGRILKGDKPADLPVELPTTFEFIMNLKAAKMLGIDVPPTLLAQADEVIE